MIKFSIQSFDTVSSTQDIIKEKLHKIEEGYVAVAKVQTQGHGRYGRVWQGDEGNLYTSTLLRPQNISQEKIGLISMAAGLAVYETIKPYIHGQSIQIKWPNDILVEDKKISGILIEAIRDENNNISGFIIGVGINIKAAPLDQAICLNAINGQENDKNKVLEGFLENLAYGYSNLTQGNEDRIINAYKVCTFEQGQKIAVKLPTKTHEGRFHDIDHTGSLILEKEDGSLVTITSGDVYLSD
tara:strand:+ start:381 stop:1106 length:726 start_codon:yes stop_codon:yes gene_type:complete